MRIAYDTGSGRLCRGRALRVLLGALVAIAALSAWTAGASAATVKAPAWKLLGSVSPTHLPPTQSEVQRLTVGAGGGTFALSVNGGEGEATPRTGSIHLELVEGSTVATIKSGGAEVGQQVSGLGIEKGTTIESCSTDCEEVGSTVTLSNPAERSRPNQNIKTYYKELTGAVGSFRVGDEVAGFGLAPETFVTGINGATLEISQFPEIVLFGAVTLTITEFTAPIAYDASAEAVQGELEAMTALGAGSVTVSGGPGGEAAHPYFLAFGGPLAEEDVPQLTPEGSALTGEGSYVHVATTVPGGAGTGQILVYPTNIGGAASTGTLTVEVGPLPAGVLTAGKAGAPQLGGIIEGHWNCPGGAGETTVTCTITEPVPGLSWGRPLGIPLEVQTATGFNAEVPVSVSEAGGGSASYLLPLVVSAEPAEAGIQTFWSGEFEANGEPSTQAGGHPFSQVTAFQLNTDRSGTGQVVPAGDLRDITVGLPAGLVGDPLATERCPQSEIFCGFEHPAASVGKFSGDVRTPEFLTLGLSNAVPPFGSAAEFGAASVSAFQTLNASVRSEEDFGINILGLNSATTWEKTYGVLTVFEGEPEGTPGAAFFSNPTDCGQERAESEEGRGPAITAKANTWQERGAYSYASSSQPVMTGCEKLEFHPSFTFQPTSTTGSTGVGATAHLHIPQEGLTNSEKLSTPDLEKSVVTLPAGFTINPAQAAGVEACSEAQVGYIGEGAMPNPTRFDEAPVTCPDASKLGSAEVSTPLLEEPMPATLYLARQEENPFHSLIALYLVIESPRFGITMKLPGEIEVDPKSGQVTAIFDHVPQQPIEDLTLNFRGGGGRSEFATPEVCGTYTTTGLWTPWSAPESGPPAETSDSFKVSGNCAASASARPFAPGFDAGTPDNRAGQSGSFVLHLSRKDGEQTLGTVETTMPPGLTGMVSKVAECPEAQANAGDCPAGSQIGHVDSSVGVGGTPLSLPEPGRREDPVFFTGPYGGAPFGLSIVVHPEAGPFNLEEGHPVVVRAALSVDPHTAQVKVVSGPVPTILRGIPLDVRGVTVTIDRPGFMVNPTSCDPMAVTGTIASSEGAKANVSSRFQAGDCGALSFKPSFKVSTSSHTSRKDGASLHVSMSYPAGAVGTQANLRYVKVALPEGLPSRLETLKQACTEQQFAANPAGCPAASAVGHAVVHTPVLPVPLEGPAYFVSHGGAKWPELVIVLQGDGVTVQLDGQTHISKGVTTSTFPATPDVPFESFELTLPSGPNSALAANGNFCYRMVTRKKRVKLRRHGHLVKRHGHVVHRIKKVHKRVRRQLIMPTSLIGQNGKAIHQKTHIQVIGCGKHRAHKASHKHAKHHHKHGRHGHQGHKTHGSRHHHGRRG